MINLNFNGKKVQWNIIAGIFLLIFAFFIIFTSNNNTSNNIETTTSKVSETTVPNTTAESVSSEEITSENIPEETTLTKKQIKNLIKFDAEYPYLIRINRAENFAVVYGMDKEGHHSIPYKTFICSTGLEEGDTPLGVFEMSDKYRWRLMVDGTYAQYAIRIEGQIMLHSVPYLEASPDTLEYWEYNKLGKPASLGCVRFRAIDIKWIYDNCKEGTKVNIYSKRGEEPPIPLKKVKKIKKSNPNSNWDPTDPDENNPWKSKNSKSKKKKNSKKIYNKKEKQQKSKNMKN